MADRRDLWDPVAPAVSFETAETSAETQHMKKKNEKTLILSLTARSREQVVNGVLTTGAAEKLILPFRSWIEVAETCSSRVPVGES